MTTVCTHWVVSQRRGAIGSGGTYFGAISLYLRAWYASRGGTTAALPATSAPAAPRPPRPRAALVCRESREVRAARFSAL